MQHTSSILGGVMDRQRQTEVTQNQRFGRKKTVKYRTKFSFWRSVLCERASVHKIHKLAGWKWRLFNWKTGAWAYGYNV